MILEAIVQFSTDLINYDGPGKVLDTLVKCVAQLLLPSEVIRGRHLVLFKLLDNVCSVHIGGDKRDNNLALQRRQLSADHGNERSDLGSVLLVRVVQCQWVASLFLNSVLGARAPHDLSDGGNNLSRVGQDELLTVLCSVVVDTLAHLLSQRADHFILKLPEPLLDRTMSLWLLLKFNLFLLARNDTFNSLLVKLHSDEVIEQCLQMQLNFFNFLRVGKDVNKLIVRQEVEAREGLSLLLHVVLKSVVTLLKNSIVFLKLIEHVLI